jgi:amino acid transporter
LDPCSGEFVSLLSSIFALSVPLAVFTESMPKPRLLSFGSSSLCPFLFCCFSLLSSKPNFGKNSLPLFVLLSHFPVTPQPMQSSLWSLSDLALSQHVRCVTYSSDALTRADQTLLPKHCFPGVHDNLSSPLTSLTSSFSISTISLFLLLPVPAHSL